METARVIAVDRDYCVVASGSRERPAEMTGRLMFGAESPLDYPAVGDWVKVQWVDQGARGMIHAVLPRQTLLKRKTSGRRISYQLIAANIDTAFIVQSLDANYNIRRLERYLVMVYDGGIEPVVLLSKSDLLSPHEIQKKVETIHAIFPDISIIPFSNKNGEGLGAVTAWLRPGKIFCLIGSSGVGKTTLLNQLLGEERFQTRMVRETDSKGRHATTRRQLITLENNAMIVDTPGMRELGNIAVDSGLESTFPEIDELSKNCRYQDCSHTQEKGCSVLLAVSEGTLSRERYQNYIKMKKESLFHEMSYLEKKKRDKAFGKMCKSMMKSKKFRR